jgi:hypothetical protein
MLGLMAKVVIKRFYFFYGFALSCSPLILKYFPIEHIFIQLCWVDKKSGDQKALELLLHQKEVAKKV